MEAGASILAFVTAGLQSAKLAYDVISGIRDRPQKVRDLESALGRLVQQLAYLEANPSLVPQKDAAVIQRCRDDLGQIRIDIEKLRVSPGDGKLKSVWKKMRPALNEKDIGHILAKVAAQTAAIGVYVVVAQSAIVTEIHARQSDLHKENKAALDKQSAGVAEIQTRQSAFHQEHKATLEKQSADISKMASRQITIHDTATGNTSILMEIASRQTTTQAALVQQHASLAESATRREAFEDKLFRSLELQQALLQSGAAGAGAVLEQLSALLPSLAALASNTPTSSSSEDAQAYAELLTSIATLRVLVDKEGRLIPSNETEAIKQAVQNILQFLAKELRTNSSGYWYFGETQSKDATRILKQLGSHFAPENLINLNPTSIRTPSLIGERRIQADSISMDLILQQAGFSITRRRLTSTSNETCGTPDQGAQETGRQAGHYDTEMQSNLTIWSRRKGPAGGFVLKASVVEALNNLTGARIALAPIVAVYRTVPSNSEVFQSIRAGRLDKLVGLISTGKASVRDRDEHGASLLHYACHGQGRPDICKFLLEHGADPNDEAKDCSIFGFPDFGLKADTPLSLLLSFPRELGVDGKPTVACAQYLLQYGAEVVSDGVLRTALGFGTELNLRQVLLRVARSTTDLSQRLIDGKSLFSYFCSSYPVSFATLRSLVEAGVSVNGVFSHEAPPLVLVLKLLAHEQKCHLEGRRGKHTVEMIKYLIDKGADVNATWDGHSCTAIAYAMDSATSSYIGDVWDAALASTGYDVEEFRRREDQPHYPRFWTGPRTPWTRFPASYTLVEVRDLWEGVEDRCPYYGQVMSAGEDKVFIAGKDCGEAWCRLRMSRVKELQYSSSEWETESEGGMLERRHKLIV